MRHWLGIVLLTLAVPRPASAEPTSWHEGVAGQRRVRHLVAVSIAGAVYAASETVLKGSLAPDHCRWCQPPSLDESVRDALVWDDRGRARTLSNLTGYVAAPVFGVGLSALAAASAAEPGSRFGRVLDDTLPIFEAVAYSQLLVQAVKFSVGRARPRVHFSTTGTGSGKDDNVSFFSGHTELGFAIAVSAGMVAHRRGSSLEPAVWTLGLGLAATTGYLRIAADEHYLTDVAVGALFGASMGYVIPRLLWGESAHHLALLPTGRGLALSGEL
jgi:membrane-associated phospholipid phosphatase